MAVDVADWESTQSLARETGRHAGRPDVLVVSAGVIQPAGRVWEVSARRGAGCVQVNLVGAFIRCGHSFPHDRRRRGAAPPRGITVVLVSTGGTRYAVPGWSAYGAAKSGLDYLGRNLQAELDLEGIPISVYTVYPGVIDTPMQETIRGMAEADFPDVERIRRHAREGRLRPPEQPATLIWWLAAFARSRPARRVVDIDSPDIRSRVASDLGLPQFLGGA